MNSGILRNACRSITVWLVTVAAVVIAALSVAGWAASYWRTLIVRHHDLDGQVARVVNVGGYRGLLVLNHYRTSPKVEQVWAPPPADWEGFHYMALSGQQGELDTLPSGTAGFAFEAESSPGGGNGQYTVCIPLWFVFILGLLTVLLASRGIRRRARRRSRLRVGRCPECGYDLRASAGTCPECGAGPQPDALGAASPV